VDRTHYSGNLMEQDETGGHIACMRVKGEKYMVFVEEHKGKRPRCR